MGSRWRRRRVSHRTFVESLIGKELAAKLPKRTLRPNTIEREGAPPVHESNEEGETATIGGSGGNSELVGDCASLWELVLCTSETEASMRGNDADAHQLRSRKLPKYINLAEAVNRRRIRDASLGNASDITLMEGIRSRIVVWRQVEQAYADKLIRWDVMKAQMLEGVQQNGVLQDTGVGRTVRVPLWMSVRMTTEASYFERVRIFSTPVVMDAMLAIWEDIGQRGNITEGTYFALSKPVVASFFPHLNEREVHQVILQDSETDYPPSGVMLKRGFLRYLASLLLAMMESHAASEALNLLQALRRLWQRHFDYLDMDFFERYSRKDPSPLVPSVPPRAFADDEALVAFAKAEVAKAVQIRFSMVRAEAEAQLKSRKLKKNRNRFATAKKQGGWNFFMAPEADRPEGKRCDEDDALELESVAQSGILAHNQSNISLLLSGGSRVRFPRLHSVTSFVSQDLESPASESESARLSRMDAEARSEIARRDLEAIKMSKRQHRQFVPPARTAETPDPLATCQNLSVAHYAMPKLPPIREFSSSHDTYNLRAGTSCDMVEWQEMERLRAQGRPQGDLPLPTLGDPRATLKAIGDKQLTDFTSQQRAAMTRRQRHPHNPRAGWK